MQYDTDFEAFEDILSATHGPLNRAAIQLIRAKLRTFQSDNDLDAQHTQHQVFRAVGFVSRMANSAQAAQLVRAIDLQFKALPDFAKRYARHKSFMRAHAYVGLVPKVSRLRNK
jgi:hypothetical protein